MPEGGGGWVQGCKQAGGCTGGGRKTVKHRYAGRWSGELKVHDLQAEQAGADAAQAQVHLKLTQEAAAAATRMRKLLDKRMTALRAKAQAATQVGPVHA